MFEEKQRHLFYITLLKTNKRDRYEGVAVQIPYLWFEIRCFDKSHLNTDTGSAFQLPSIYKNSRGFVL